MKKPFSRKRAGEEPEQDVLESSDAQDELLSEEGASEDLEEAASPPGVVLALFRRGHSAMRAPWSIWKIAAVVVLVYVAAANISYFVVLRPVWVRLEALKDKKNIVQDLFIVRESSTAVAGFKDALMHGDQRMTVIAVLEEMGEDAGLRFSREPKLLAETDLSKRVTEYPIELTLKGSFHELGQFISAIESSDRYLAVRSVEIDGPKNGKGDAEATIIVGAISWEGGRGDD